MSTAGVTSANAAADISAFVTNAQAAVDAAFGAGKIVVDKTGGGNLRFTTVAVGTNATITAANVRAVDGNGVVSNTAGMTNTTAAGQAATSLSAATLTSGAAFAGPVTFGDQTVLSFNVSVDGGTATKVTIDKATINAALSASTGSTVTNGTMTSASDYLTVVSKALQNASLNSVLTASLDGSNRLVLTKQTQGVGSIAIDPASVVASAGADSLSIDKIDISDATLSARGVNGTNRATVLKAYITLVNNAITKVTSAAAALGSVASRIDSQKSFVNTLMDTIDKGVSNLVDADMTEESTKLQALQVKQQLGTQALSIANQSAQGVLSLFRS
ncbi:flagellin [Aureimonas sp. D3]|uniref:flagellin n=1 Tax=Aureimonas sp. D3 TaxID=1638164 RepID=UPI001FCCE379